MINRRRWLQVGLVGGAALGLAGLAGPWVLRHGNQDAVAFEAASRTGPWSPQAARLIGALAPVILGGACTPGPACAGVVDGVKTAVAALSPAAQRDLGELFMLLNLPVVRSLATGVWAEWDQAAAPDIESFLQRWRNSRVALLQAGYHALHDLILAAWYAQPQSWPDIGYPGPPQLEPR